MTYLLDHTGENIRIISARLATDTEKELYYDQNIQY